MRYFRYLAAVSLGVLCLWTPVYAATGIAVSPSRYELIETAGTTKTLSTIVTNNSSKSLAIAPQVQQFATSDTNTITLKDPEYDWIRPTNAPSTLKPGERSTITYTLSIPQGAHNGEYYFALLASTTLDDQAGSKTIQVATLVYVYVNGGTVEHASTITDTSIPAVVTGLSIPYAYTVKNTGNIHARLLPTVTLHGMSWNTSDTSDQYVILPARVRTIAGTISSPIFPGLYTLTYSYKDEATQKITTYNKQIMYIPPWSIAAAVLLFLVITWLFQRYRKRKNQVRPTAV